MISGWAANAGLIVKRKTIIIRNSPSCFFGIKNAPLGLQNVINFLSIDGNCRRFTI